ncbi:MAG: NAD+ synthase [Actinomycetota bacterium]|nr:NAD+ synthase [Actinomycetota bacterium]
MAQLRVALAQVDVTVGDLAGNADVVLEWAGRAAQAGAHLVAFPEMSLTGYPAEDLVLRESFGRASVERVARLATRLADIDLGELAVVVGYLDTDGGPRNAAALLHGGRVVARYFKHHLPNYGVFDEDRYFRAGDQFVVVRLHGVDVALTICEDMWVDGGPFAVAAAAEVGLLVNINGSPYERNKDDFRLALAARRAREAGAAVAYVNMVGGQDELVFDGDSMVVGADGGLIARAPQFDETLLVVDLDLPAAGSDLTGPVDAFTVTRAVVSAGVLPDFPAGAPPVAEPLGDEAEVWAALVTGTRDYVRKNGFRSAVLGLSGGIDSAVVATIARDALGPAAVHTVGLPSRYSSEHSLADAEDLARRQGLHWRVIPIDAMVRAYESTVGLTGLAAENLQARVRGTLLMALSNQDGHLVLTTGNKSELATGYSTMYGDSAGGFAPIKDVPKTLVWQLARWRNAVADKAGEPAPIPQSSIDKAPSAELAPGQLDSDRLPAYDLLDPLLADYVDRDLGRAALIARGHDPDLVERVIRLVDQAEYKRRQYPPGPKISLKAFGRDRRLPITSRWREPAPGTGH